MEAIENNNRAFVTTTLIMLVVAGLVVLAGLILFPLTLYDDPNASYFNLPSFYGTRTGSIIIFTLFGILALNMAVFLSRITRLEQERTTLQARLANAEIPSAPQVSGRDDRPLPPPR